MMQNQDFFRFLIYSAPSAMFFADFYIFNAKVYHALENPLPIYIYCFILLLGLGLRSQNAYDTL